MGVYLRMSKERTSLTLDPEVANFLRQDHVNASGLVNKLVQQHMNGGAGEDLIREFRIQQLESELNQIQTQEEQKRKELEKLQEIDSEKSQEQREALEEAKEALKHTPRDPENPAIKKQADKLGMDPEDLVDELAGDGE
jgi:hypothetical protein